ncbi:hypothetical protein N7495_006208 [Penicillium taxi]|uniref:uncharacterized protein n=1 Tax=Penicillium taxi TaxID=168475 RepID=UPI0025457D61|nr:uncharacterized protein N7495_006208 [Penicillium taxi]KAJ5894517.1 hypothetical protein N7495_006208 [Penicillium taxi]
MNFDHFIGLCGRSIFAEEYRGDLHAAGDYLQIHPDAGIESKAEHLRCRSIYSILTGKLSDAYENLTALHNLLSQLPPEWGLRCSNYKALADYTRRYPPMIRFYHERGKPLNLVTISDIIGFWEISQKLTAGCLKYTPATSRDRELCLVLSAVVWHPFHVRNLTNTLHPLSPSALQYPSDADLEPVISKKASLFLKYRQTAEENDSPEIATYLTRLIVEFHIACRSSQSASALEGLYDIYEEIDDYAGMANSKMMRADSLLCPPFTSPVSMNLILTDNNSAIAEDPIWDPIEHDLTFEYSSQASNCYENALDLFNRAACNRGQAAVLLRQACCLHLVARNRRRENEDYLDLIDEASIKLQESLELFGDDEANLQLVKAHQILLRIFEGNLQRGKILARQIGEWGAQNKNETLIHFIGLLFSRFAQQEWSKYSNLDTALQAWECAYEVLEPMGDLIPMFQSVVARAAAHHDIFNSTEALLLIEQGYAMVDPLINHLNRMINSQPDNEVMKVDRSTLIIMRCTILWSFGQIMTRTYLRMEDLQAFLQWQEKLNQWYEDDDHFREWIQKLENARLNRLFNSEVGFSATSHRDIWRRSIAEDTARVEYSSCEIKFRRLLDEGNVIEAEETLRRFVAEAELLEKCYTRNLNRILAYERIGDLVKARESLDAIDDNELFNGDLEYYRKNTAVRLAFPTVAQNALSFSIYGRDMQRARRLITIITDISPTFFDDAIDNVFDHSNRLGQFGTIMMDVDPELALSKLLLARKMIETRRSQTTDMDARIGHSRVSWSNEVYQDLARICLTYADSDAPLGLIQKYEHGHFEEASWAEHALLFVEMNRARTVLDSLSLQPDAAQAADIPGIPKIASLSEAVQKRRLLRSLMALRSMTPEQKLEASQLQADIEALEEDGTLSSAATFIDSVNSAIDPKKLYQSIDSNTVVIETTFGSRGMIAFAVTRNGIQRAYQESTRLVDMRRNVMLAMQVMREMSGTLGEEEENRKKALYTLTQTISDVLLVPFAEIIRAKSHIIFSLSDPLTAFPFSILPFDDKPLIMHAAISQVPSLTILYHLSRREMKSEAPTVSVLAKSPIVASEDVARAQSEVNLHMAGIEAVNIARLFATWPIEASTLSRKDFQDYVEGESLIMHIGTHGNFNHRSPLLSSISIGDGQEFRVADMSAIKSKVNLLVFAACLSGLGKATIGNEVLGFSHVVLSTGCQAYIGALWEVSDFGSMFIMTLFYRYLKNNAHLTVSDIMRKAQINLLLLDSNKAEEFLNDILEDWTVQRGHDPSEFVPDAKYLLHIKRMILTQLDWSSPFYWAPFTLVGYGGFRFVHDR